jgi:hypothetical protein
LKWCGGVLFWCQQPDKIADASTKWNVKVTELRPTGYLFNEKLNHNPQISGLAKQASRKLTQHESFETMVWERNSLRNETASHLVNLLIGLPTSAYRGKTG